MTLTIKLDKKWSSFQLWASHIALLPFRRSRNIMPYWRHIGGIMRARARRESSRAERLLVELNVVMVSRPPPSGAGARDPKPLNTPK